jgi:ubiquinone/menaquinone biosynthesis C-methylase UbiE
MPFADGSFDAAVSTFGVMFAPDQPRAARELTRVVRPGGVIALANWTPEGFIGKLLATVGKRVPPPPGVASPIYWGKESRLGELFPDARSIQCVRQHFAFRYESAAHFVQVFRDYYGPTHRAFAALDATGQKQLTEDLSTLIESFARPTRTRGIAIPGEYLEVVIER